VRSTSQNADLSKTLGAENGFKGVRRKGRKIKRMGWALTQLTKLNFFWAFE
jgi:hypothetical protein